MNKLIGLSMALMVVVQLVGCGNNKPDATNKGANTKHEAAPVLTSKQESLALQAELQQGAVGNDKKDQHVKVEIGDLGKFPEDYVGKTLEVSVWIYNDAFTLSNDFEGLYSLTVRNKGLGTIYGTLGGSVGKNGIAFLISKDQAKTISKEIGDRPEERKVVIKFTKEIVKGEQAYIGRISQIAKP